MLTANGIARSISRRGDCWDNAVVESFSSTLKIELASESLWDARSEVPAAIFEYLACPTTNGDNIPRSRMSLLLHSSRLTNRKRKAAQPGCLRKRAKPSMQPRTHRRFR